MDQNVSLKTSAGTVPAPVITLLALSRIVVSSTLLQARRRQRYDMSALAELSDNIKGVGVIEPIIVRTLKSSQGTATHEIVAGERRWRAAQLAGISVVPTIIRTLDERSSALYSLAENIARSDLNPMELARGYQSVLQEHDFSQTALAEAIGQNVKTVNRILRLLKLRWLQYYKSSQGII